MLIIGICGASGSGKTTLAEELASTVKHPPVLLRQDTYYRNYSHLDFEERRKLNYDEPSIFDHDAMYQDLCDLCAGKPVPRREYDFAAHCVVPSSGWISPAEVIIIEGIHSFYDARIREMMDFKLFVKVDPDICLLRRMQRDIRDRGRDVDDISRQYLDTVKPMYEQYIRGYADYADAIISHGGKNQKIVDILGHYINTRLIEA